MSIRGWAIFVALGLALGIALGALYGWVIDPVEYVDTEPSSLSAAHKAEYMRLVAAAYAETGDLERARARLAALGETDAAQSVAALAQQSAAEGRALAEVRGLADLASALGAGPAPVAQAASATLSPATDTPRPPTDTPTATVTRTSVVFPTLTGSPTARPLSTDTPTAILPPGVTPSPTQTSTPTLTPTPTVTPLVLFALVGEKEKVCRPELGQALIQVEARDRSNRPVSGVEVVVEWQEGGEQKSNHFFTGLKPELGAGYADFAMREGVSYSLRLEQGSGVVSGIRAEACSPTSGSPYPGSWRLTFRQ